MLRSYCAPKEGEPWIVNKQKPIPKILEEDLPYLCSTMRPSNEITFTKEPAKPWDSKLGGCPYLTEESQYPRDEEGRPMMFLAQINFEQMPPLPDFPQKGILQFYLLDDEIYGLEDGCCLRYIPDVLMDESRLLRENPFRDYYENEEPFDNDCKMEFHPCKMFLSMESHEFTDHYCGDLAYTKLSEEKQDALFDLCYACDSRVGGYPLFVQGAPCYYEDGSLDVLLLQLDVDDTSGLMFGDGGNCNFFISREDLKNLNFERAEFDWQCG